MHDFDIKTGLDETVVLFCRKCALSFVLAKRGGLGQASRSVWERVDFADSIGQDTDPPCKTCSESEDAER